MKYFTLLGLLMFLSCSKSLDYKNYLQWYESESNPLRKTQTIGDVQYTCTYMLTDYFKAREKASAGNQDQGQTDESEYYKVNIKITNNQEPLTYHLKNSAQSYERINYLVSDVKDDVLLLTSNDTLTCQMHHYERVYHVGNTLSVMFIFDKTHEQKQRTIAFNDKLFGHGVIKFTFSQDEINAVPPLKK